MVKFLDGPAAGVELQLRRAPLLLRVVRDRDGKFDALDQLDDEPKREESIIVYIATPGTFSRYHVSRSPRSASGFYESSSYVVLPVQPEDWQIRENSNWQAWCKSVEAEMRALHETLRPETVK